MTKTATLLAENLTHFCPVTNHYQCSDGRYLLVTYPRVDVLAAIAGEALSDALTLLGIAEGPQTLSHQPANTEVFSSDEAARVLDADGDPANGMTPLLRCDGPVPIADALASLGYTLTEGE